MVVATQVCSVLCMIICRLQKTKAKSLIFICLANAISVATYFLFDQTAGAFLSIAALLRTIIFFLYDRFKLKPNFVVFAMFEATFIAITILTWQGAVDVLILLSVAIFTYTTWQNNMYVMRIGMIIDPSVLIIYNAIIGGYVNIIGEVLVLISTVYAIIYYDIQKRTTSIFKRAMYYIKPKIKRKRLKTRLQRSKTK